MDDKIPIIQRNAGSTRFASQENVHDKNVPLSHPDHFCQRLIALFLMCLLGFGSYFCYDNPGALQDNFINDMSLKTSQFMLLYSWYSWPNVICCFIGGFLLDRVFGIRLGTCLYCLLVVAGQIIFAVGAFTNSLLITIIGRFIFGLGGESLAVAQNNYAVLWFKGKELNMVFGFQLSFARAGSAVNFVFMEPIYRYISRFYHSYQCLGISLLIASLSCIMSFLSATILACQDKRAERFLERHRSKSEEIVRLSDVKKFPPSFWLTAFVILFYYVAIFCFVSLGKVFFERKFGLDPDESNWINSLVYVISAFVCPFLGFIIDRMGRNVFWVFISILSTLVGHMLIAFTFLNPYVGMGFIAFGYSMVGSALWPLIALVVPEYQLGTAYGVAQSLQNTGQALFTLSSGYIVDYYGYLMLEIFFVGCLSVSLLLVIILWVYDTSSTCLLNMSTAQRTVFEHSKRAADITEKEKLIATGSVCDISSDDLEHLPSSSYLRNKYENNYRDNSEEKSEKRPQFGARVLTNSSDVYKYNAWDNVNWDESREEEAFKITSGHCKDVISSDEFNEIEENANKYWDNFYITHKDGFFKDRHWLFTEFPELSSKYMSKSFPVRVVDNATNESNSELDNLKTNNHSTTCRNILEIGCGVGNTVFPILQYNNDPNLTVYCCDFSEEAIRMLKLSPECTNRCIPFVCDITCEEWITPFEVNSLDVILMVYVLSSINPSKMRNAIQKVYNYLKPGGLLLFRDYGRYDLAQLRFKAGHCVSNNFYVRGEKTLVYFFTKEEIRDMFTECGFEEIQNVCDKRLQVNRRKQLKMYRVWIQAKYRKPILDLNQSGN